MIKIQKEDFNIDFEINKIISKYSEIGAVSIFVGYVRNINQNKKVKFIDLEVYEKMAKKKLDDVSLFAIKNWSLTDVLVIHRFGKLLINDKIVLVATFAKHRNESFSACNHIMDFLKKDAPFWKKEYYIEGSKWL